MTPRLRSSTVPRWTVVVLMLQIEIVLIFAGIVKVNLDWLQLQPLTIWLGKRTDLPLIGAYFGETWAVALASYGAIALHLVGAPLLLWRRTGCGCSSSMWYFTLRTPRCSGSGYSRG